MKKYFPFTIHVVAPILIGGAIYLVWRNPNLLMFDWLRGLGLDTAIATLRSGAGATPVSWPRWVLSSLPDGLWVYALTALMALLWRDARLTPLKIFWVSIGFILGAGSELGQMLHIVPGSFDPVDLLFCLVAAPAAVLLTSPKSKFAIFSSQGV